ncbi:MAG: YidC/Oxa1 family membrane protein insertase [Ruminococcus sp.]|nr:YidC/Oxa1 family membrane protein insertase [Ruminococcus sp.]
MNLLATPLGWIMKFCYSLVHNYGIALFLFTFITRLVVFPLSIKQQKSTARMAMISPEIEKLKKKYAKNKEKLNEETMKLYSKENVNPMASCLPMIITMVILFSLIPVIYSPLTYISNADKDDVEKSNNLITNIYVASEEIKSKDTSIEELIAKFEKDGKDPYEALEKELKDKYSKTAKSIDSSEEWEYFIDAIKKHPDIDKFILDENNVSKNLAQSRPELITFDFVKKADGKYADVLPEIVREEAEKFNYEFLGMPLGKIPQWKFSLDSLFFIPLLSAILQFVTTIVSQRFTKKNNPAAANMGGGMKAMFYIMPIFSLWICFSYPAGLGLYWIYSSFFALIQTLVLNILYSPAKVQEMVKKDMAKQKAKKKKPSMYERAMAMQNQQNGNVQNSEDDDEDEERKLSKAEMKELQRNRINEARRRMAEKYGEEYNEKE